MKLYAATGSRTKARARCDPSVRKFLQKNKGPDCMASTNDAPIVMVDLVSECGVLSSFAAAGGGKGLRPSYLACRSTNSN